MSPKSPAKALEIDDSAYLPLTTKLLASSPYERLADPAADIAERLIALTHIGFNASVWAVSPERRKRYWSAFSEHVVGSANTNKVSIWWSQVQEGMVTVPMNDLPHLHEKNLLLNPSALQVPATDQEVLQVFRTQSDYLLDRARVWVAVRREEKKA